MLSPASIPVRAVAESLASFIRASSAESGLAIGGDDVTISQYADDITIVVSDNASFNGVDECLTVFQRGSRARLNRAKSEELWVGPWTARTDHLVLSGILMQSSLLVCG